MRDYDLRWLTQSVIRMIEKDVQDPSDSLISISGLQTPFGSQSDNDESLVEESQFLGAKCYCSDVSNSGIFSRELD